VLLVFAIPYFYLISTGDVVLATIADVIGFGFVFDFGATPTFYTENFPTRYRASSAGAAYQIAQVYGGGIAGATPALRLCRLDDHRGRTKSPGPPSVALVRFTLTGSE
jgi:hypothetical protein